MRKHRWFTLLAVVATAVLLTGPLSTAADAQTPDYYPAGFTLGTTAYSLRFAGNNRAQTAGTVAETGAINSGGSVGAYPFNNPDRTDPGVAYEGAGCPAVVGISASDTPADALAASQAWETTLDGVSVLGGGTQDNVSTTDGYMLLTTANRDGSSPDLDAATIQTIQDIRNRCGSFDALVFGGTSAVSSTALTTLDALTNTVYQFAGTDRYDTARKIAVANFENHGLSSVTDFTSASSAISRPNTVFLAEGVTGADALAIGPYAAVNNVPVLLTDSATLPEPTRLGLIALAPDNIIVLGGTAAISDAVASAAAAAAGGATVTRIAGTDRYESSIAIAKRLFDDYPEFALSGNVANGEYSGALWAFARSEGSGASHVGWPDALASAWFLGGIDNENDCMPTRLAPPVEKNTGVELNACPEFDVPLLLTQASGLPASVQSYLASLYPDPDNIVTATNPGGGDDGGFGFVFGGTAAVSQAAELAIASALSGGTYTSANRSDLSPSMTAGSVFYTAIDLTGYTAGASDLGGFVNGNTSNDKVCALRNALSGSEWFAEYSPVDGSFLNDRNLVPYQDSGTAWAAAQSRPQCIDSAANADSMATVFGISLSGHESGTKTLDWSNGAARLVTAPGVDAAPDTSSETPANCNAFTDNQADGATCVSNLTFSGAMPVTSFQGTSFPGATFTLSLAITRSDPADTVNQANDAITVSGSLTVSNGATTLFTASLAGESSTTSSPLKVSGMYNESGNLGGFHLTLTGTTGTAALTDLVLDGLGA